MGFGLPQKYWCFFTRRRGEVLKWEEEATNNTKRTDPSHQPCLSADCHDGNYIFKSKDFSTKRQTPTGYMDFPYHKHKCTNLMGLPWGSTTNNHIECCFWWREEAEEAPVCMEPNWLNWDYTLSDLCNSLHSSSMEWAVYVKLSNFTTWRQKFNLIFNTDYRWQRWPWTSYNVTCTYLGVTLLKIRDWPSKISARVIPETRVGHLLITWHAVVNEWHRKWETTSPNSMWSVGNSKHPDRDIIIIYSVLEKFLGTEFMIMHAFVQNNKKTPCT